MATISITIPNGVVSRVQNAFASAYGYKATIPDPANPPNGTLPNPETITQFTQRKLRDYIKETVVSQEAVAAGETARKAAAAAAEADIALT